MAPCRVLIHVEWLVLDFWVGVSSSGYVSYILLAVLALLPWIDTELGQVAPDHCKSRKLPCIYRQPFNILAVIFLHWACWICANKGEVFRDLPSACFKLQQKSGQMPKKKAVYDSAPASLLYGFNSGSNKLLLISLAALSIMRIKINILWSMSVFPLHLYLPLKNAAKCIDLSWCTVQKRFLLFCWRSGSVDLRRSEHLC